MTEPAAVHTPDPDAERRRPPEPNDAPPDKPGTGTPILKPQPPSEGTPAGQKG
jgi:hypothetical protein